MVRITGQNIPSADLYLYEGSMQVATGLKTVLTNKYNTFKYSKSKYRSSYYVRMRYPFTMKSRRGRDDIHSATVKQIASSTPYPWRRKKLGTPSAAQLWVRNIFCKGAACFREQPQAGYWDGKSAGPRGRDWWYDLSLGTGLYYYPNFMSNTLIPLFGSKVFNWDGPIASGIKYRGNDGILHDPHFFIKVDEADFLTFYADMAAFLGWSWNANSDPDVVAHTMCKTVYEQIENFADDVNDLWSTPGETSSLGAGDCEDKGILTYAMIWKTLKDIGKSDSFIDARLKCIAYNATFGGHVIGVWKDNGDKYRALPTTGVIGSPGTGISNCPLLTATIGISGIFAWNKTHTREPYTKGIPYTPEWCYGYPKNIYVTDYINCYVQIFDSYYQYVSRFGKKGGEDGEFYGICGITVSEDKIYITDHLACRVQIFDLDGNFISKFGSMGEEDGQFQCPSGIAISGNKIYIADSYNYRVQIFDLDGNFISKFGSRGTDDGQFDLPYGIAVAGSKIYITDYNNYRVQIFGLGGGFISKFGSYGSGPGQFDKPYDIIIISSQIYVTDCFNHRVQIFGSGGGFIRKFGSYGSGPGQFDEANGITVVGSKIYVTDRNNHRVQIFGSGGGFISKFGSVGYGDGLFIMPVFLHVTKTT